MYGNDQLHPNGSLARGSLIALLPGNVRRAWDWWSLKAPSSVANKAADHCPETTAAGMRRVSINQLCNQPINQSISQRARRTDVARRGVARRGCVMSVLCRAVMGSSDGDETMQTNPLINETRTPHPDISLDCSTRRMSTPYPTRHHPTPPELVCPPTPWLFLTCLDYNDTRPISCQ